MRSVKMSFSFKTRKLSWQAFQFDFEKFFVFLTFVYLLTVYRLAIKCDFYKLFIKASKISLMSINNI